MYCSKCGIPLNGNEGFCPNCGAKIEQTANGVWEQNTYIHANGTVGENTELHMKDAYNVEKKELKNQREKKTVIVIISILLLVVLIMCIVGAYCLHIYFRNNKEAEKADNHNNNNYEEKAEFNRSDEMTEADSFNETTEMGNSNENTEADYSDEENGIEIYEAFQKKRVELENIYGAFESNQSGIMYNWEDEWFNPEGVLSTTILDFDSDGKDEMLVCISERGSDDLYNIVMHMYDVVNGDIVETDQMLFGAYIKNKDKETNVAIVNLMQNYWAEEITVINAVLVDGRYYIVCENESVSSAFADGMGQSYWILEYVNGKFQYVCSFTQIGGGSSDFAYTGYTFEDGVLTKDDLYYSEWYEDAPLYTDFGEAISNFFSDYGIQLKSTIKDSEYAYLSNNNFESILSDENNNMLIFKLVNKMTRSDWTNSTFEFLATLNNNEVEEDEQTSGSEKGDKMVIADDNITDYILPESNSSYLTKADIEGLTAYECMMARNEIYARYGRKFKDSEIQEYFNSCEWYTPRIESDDFQESILNDYEIANLKLIVEYEEEKGYK